MKKLFFVMNPFAGQRRANRQLAEIIGIFNRANYIVNTYMTASSGDCEKAVMRFAQDADLVVCCGGDGTFNEAVSGMLKCGMDVPIGYLPAGSTNDFASSLKLSSDLLAAARDIVEGTEERIDVGSFGGRYFSYVASFGAFTKTSYTTPQNVKNMLGHLAYVLSGIQELSQMKTHFLRFELPDGQVVEDNFLFGAVSNSTSVGGVLTLAPDKVDMTDGKFELLLVRAPRDAFELTDCLMALQRQTYNCAMMTFLSTPSVKITAPKDMAWTLDGEREDGHSNIEINCLQHAFSLIRRRKG